MYLELLANPSLLGLDENYTAGGMCWHSKQLLKGPEDTLGASGELPPHGGDSDQGEQETGGLGL